MGGETVMVTTDLLAREAAEQMERIEDDRQAAEIGHRLDEAVGMLERLPDGYSIQRTHDARQRRCAFAAMHGSMRVATVVRDRMLSGVSVRVMFGPYSTNPSAARAVSVCVMLAALDAETVESNQRVPA